jgi:hypothetical protein
MLTRSLLLQIAATSIVRISMLKMALIFFAACTYCLQKPAYLFQLLDPSLLILMRKLAVSVAARLPCRLGRSTAARLLSCHFD